jgi:hypothetical protein
LKTPASNLFRPRAATTFTQEHTPFHGKHPWTRKVVTLVFSGTYSDDSAEIDAVALVGKQSPRFKSILRLLVAAD